MKAFFKYAGLAIGIQIFLCAAAWVMIAYSPWHSSTLGDLIFYLYWPVIAVVETLGNYKMESLYKPVFYGISLGILLYGSIIGLLVSYWKGGAS